MMRRHRYILLVACLVAISALAGCDDSAVTQPNEERTSEVAVSSNTEETAANDSTTGEPKPSSPNEETTKPAEVADEADSSPPTEQSPPTERAEKEPEAKQEPDESPEETASSEEPPSRHTRPPFRRPPLPNETAPAPQPRVVRPTSTGMASSGGVTEITFDTIKFDIEPGDPFEPEMLTEEIENLFGKKVRIRGYIYPPFQQTGIKQFVLVRDNMECCFGPGAALYDCVAVDMVDGKSIDYTVRPVAVEGTFRLNEVLGLGGEHLSVFHLDGVKVQ